MADLDRLIREQHPEVGQLRVPVPQYQKVGGVGYEKVTGQHGGAHAVLLGPNGQPISSVNRLPVEVAGEVGIAGGSIGVTGNVGITGVAANTLQIIADNQGRLYGRTAGGSWLPVRVNNDGQLELAQNVTIDNVTVNVGAEVKVNNTPEDPVNVQLSGNIATLETIINAQSVPPEGNTGMIQVPTLGCKRMLFLVNCDKEWKFTTNTLTSNVDAGADHTYPDRWTSNQSPVTSFNYPEQIVVGYRITNAANLNEALRWGILWHNVRVRINNVSAETATVTVRVIRFWEV